MYTDDAGSRGLLLGWREAAGRSLLAGHRKIEPARAPIWHDGEGHLITVAPTGAGKGVSCIIPALLTWDGPAIVVDPKGENFAVTAKRRAAMGQRIHVLDPFNVTGADIRAALNPLDLLDRKSPSVSDDAALLTTLLVQGQTFKHDPFWDERAMTLITGFMLYILQGPQLLRNLAEVRYQVQQSDRDLAIVADEMRTQSSNDIKAAANILQMGLDNRTRASIMATAASHLSFIREGSVQASLWHSTINLADVQAGEPLTIYLVLPPDKLQSHGKLLRLWLGVFLTVLARRRRRPAKPTLLLVDEAAQLGELRELRTATTLLRGYGVKLWSFWQDLSQLRNIYPRDWQSLLNNCAVQQFFGASSPQAAHEIEDYLAGYAPTSLFDMRESQAVLVQRSRRPEVVTRANYFTDQQYAHLAADNHYYAAEPEPVAPRLLTYDNVIRFPTRISEETLG